MTKRIQTTIIALLAIVGSAMGQALSVSGLSDVTALQFNLQLPDGVTLDESAIKKLSAASDHKLVIRPLANGSRLFVLYNMGKAFVGNGEILRLPITAGSEAGEFSGSLNTFRTATSDAVSHAGNGATFQITVKEKDDPAQEDYPVNYDKETASITRTDRSLNGVTMNGTTYMVPKDKFLYHEDMTQTFFAQSEQRLEPQFHFTGIWMNGYVYIDRDQDGQFSYSINDDGTPTANSGLMAYSLYDEKNSVGESVTGSARFQPAEPCRRFLPHPLQGGLERD